MKPHLYVFLIFINVFIAKINAQSITPGRAFSCAESIQFEGAESAFPSSLMITNETDSIIAFMLHFKSNGFYDEATLIQYIMRGVDTLAHKAEKQLRILDNIAATIKSPMFRNYHLLFTSQDQGVVRKMYSPMLMLTSFYDMQCHHFQRLAAQIALLTSYFNASDFETYYVLRHNVLGVRIGDRFVFHDFDPGQPGFRFKLNDSVYAGIDDIVDDSKIICQRQFYRGDSLCPWIGAPYYTSSFAQIQGRSTYRDMGTVYGFMPQWIIPPGTRIEIQYPPDHPFLQFGSMIFLDSSQSVVRDIFRLHESYLLSREPTDSLALMSLFNEYMRTTHGFHFEINYMYLLNNGLLAMSDTSYVLSFADEFLMRVDVEAIDDTLFFLDDFFIPLPLRHVLVKSGRVYIEESEAGQNGVTLFQYDVTDSLSFTFYNTLPPVFTADSIRKPIVYDDKPFLVGPLKGYIKPGTKASLYYQYNPYYYRFHEKELSVNYISHCGRKIRFVVF